MSILSEPRLYIYMYILYDYICIVICIYIYIYIYIMIYIVPPPLVSVFFLVFTGFCDWFTWLEFFSSFERGYHIYNIIYSNSVVRTNFSLVGLISSRIAFQEECIQNAFLAKPKTI